MLRRAFALIKDILFPVFCVECGREGEWWCAECAEKQKITIKSYDALEPLDGAEALFVYHENRPAGKLIRQFKYSYASDAAAAFLVAARGARRDIQTFFAARGAPAMMPIPLHPRRERERGFNQARVLCDVFADVLGESGARPVVADGLRRVRYTAQQARLSKDGRLANVAGAFAWTGEYPPPQNIVLIDDVYTTGATARECAAALKAAGAEKVYVFTVAHG